MVLLLLVLPHATLLLKRLNTSMLRFTLRADPSPSIFATRRFEMKRFGPLVEPSGATGNDRPPVELGKLGPPAGSAARKRLVRCRARPLYACVRLETVNPFGRL